MWVAPNSCAHVGQATCSRLACACARASPSRGTTMCGVDAHGKRANHSRKGSFVGWSGVEVGFGCNHSNRSGNTAVCHCLHVPAQAQHTGHFRLHTVTPAPVQYYCVYTPEPHALRTLIKSPARAAVLPGSTIASPCYMSANRVQCMGCQTQDARRRHTSRTQTRTTLAHVPRIAW